MTLIDEASIIRPTIKSENGSIYKIDQIIEPNKLLLISKEGLNIQIESQSAINDYITTSPPPKGIYWPLKSIWLHQIDFQTFQSSNGNDTDYIEFIGDTQTSIICKPVFYEDKALLFTQNPIQQSTIVVQVA